MSPCHFSALNVIFLARTLELWTQKQHRNATEREVMFLDPRQAESCRSHVQDSELKDSARHGSRSVREEALTTAIFCACVDFMRAWMLNANTRLLVHLVRLSQPARTGVSFLKAHMLF